MSELYSTLKSLFDLKVATITNNTNMPKDLTNPYEHLKGTDQIIKTSVKLSVDDYQLIRQSKVSKGVVDATFSYLVHALAKAMRQHGITDYTQYNEYISLVHSLTFNYVRPIGGEAATVPNGQATISPDGRGTPTPGADVENVPVLDNRPEVRTVQRSGRPDKTGKTKGSRTKG